LCKGHPRISPVTTIHHWQKSLCPKCPDGTSINIPAASRKPSAPAQNVTIRSRKELNRPLGTDSISCCFYCSGRGAFSTYSGLTYNIPLSAKAKLFLKIATWIAALKTLGAWGVFILATIDSVAIPIPLDALVAGYVYSNPRMAWLYCIAGAVGSAVGCLVPYGLGRAGGELFLLKRIDEARLKRIRDRFEKQEFFAMMVPAMLPPPTPFKLFVFSAGVFEMRIPAFLLAIVTGRLLRFGVLSVLTVIFGPQIVTQARFLLRNHPAFALLGLLALMAAIYLIYRLMRAPVEEVVEEIQHEKGVLDTKMPRTESPGK
jgi:membrane protein YqaA with SNARE-associated domain